MQAYRTTNSLHPTYPMYRFRCVCVFFIQRLQILCIKLHYRIWRGRGKPPKWSSLLFLHIISLGVATRPRGFRVRWGEEGKKHKSQLIDLVYVCEAKLLQTHKYQVINLCSALVFFNCVHSLYILFHFQVLTLIMAKPYEFNWQKEVPSFLQEGAVFDRYEEVKECY